VVSGVIGVLPVLIGFEGLAARAHPSSEVRIGSHFPLVSTHPKKVDPSFPQYFAVLEIGMPPIAQPRADGVV
jgi:hypothetical protein